MHDKRIVFPTKGYLEYGVINSTKIIGSNQPRHIWKIIENLPKNFDGLIIDLGDLFVEEDKRDRGVATNLIETLLRIYSEDVICVNIDRVPSDMNMECVSLKQYLMVMHDFYKKLGFRRIDHSDNSLLFVYADNRTGKLIKKAIQSKNLI